MRYTIRELKPFEFECLVDSKRIRHYALYMEQCTGGMVMTRKNNRKPKNCIANTHWQLLANKKTHPLTSE